MNLSKIALVPALLLTFVTVGCASSSEAPSNAGSGSTPANGSTADGNVSLGTDAEQLVSDDTESADTDDTLEAGLDDALSGSDPSDPGTPADASSDDDLISAVTANAPKHFLDKCLTSTRQGDKVQHIFKACRTPWSLKTFEGTIMSTYVRDGNKLTITHEYNGFLADGATISGERVIEYTRELTPGSAPSPTPSTGAASPTPSTGANVPVSSTGGGSATGGGVIILKHRTGTFTGQTKKGHDLSHTANFSSTYTAATKCTTREGSAQTTLGGRLFERVLTDYERCGVGEGGCPSAGGKLQLSRTNANGTATVSIAFLGGDQMAVTRKDGTVVDRTLQCNLAAD